MSEPGERKIDEEISKIETELKVQIVPVKLQIPDIRLDVVGVVDNVDYKSNRFGDPFIKDFFKYVFDKYTDDPELWPAFRERFDNQVVVDLGANDHSFGYFLSVVLGAKGYVGVDKFRCQGLEESLSNMSAKDINKLCETFELFNEIPKELLNEGEESPIPGKNLIPASAVADDMLSFLKRLPDDSVSIFTFGITYEIVEPSYLAEVAKEIERVLSKDGMYVSDSSSVPTSGFKKFAEQLKEKGETFSCIDVLKKEGFYVKNNKK